MGPATATGYGYLMVIVPWPEIHGSFVPIRLSWFRERVEGTRASLRCLLVLNSGARVGLRVWVGLLFYLGGLPFALFWFSFIFRYPWCWMLDYFDIWLVYGFAKEYHFTLLFYVLRDTISTPCCVSLLWVQSADPKTRIHLNQSTEHNCAQDPGGTRRSE